MRFDGILEKWNDERGFGFIAPSRGEGHVFVHVSAFPHDGRRPRVGETLSFAIELGADGRKQAVDVRRASEAAPRAASSRETTLEARRGARRVRASRTSSPKRGGRVVALVVVLLVAVIAAAFGWTRLQSPTRPVPQAAPLRVAAPVESARFRCDGRKYCSQMTSCDEAKFFLRNCPGVKMDGDGDGIPCERQWCTR